jgi:hypothetical protein
MERNGLPMLCVRDATPLAEEVTGSKRLDIIGTGQLALGWWVQWGGGMGTRNDADLCRHLSDWRFSKVCILLIVPVG